MNEIDRVYRQLDKIEKKVDKILFQISDNRAELSKFKANIKMQWALIFAMLSAIVAQSIKTML